MPNSKTMTIINYLTFVAGIFGVYVLYCLWMIEDNKLPLWGLAYSLAFSAFIICFWGLRKFKYWALLLSHALMLAVLGLGIYLVHFVWTFWIFTEPTIRDRILSVLHPRIFVFIAVPAFWLIFFTRPAQRKFFT